MKPRTYLEKYGPPPAHSKWGITELARGTDAPEPAICVVAKFGLAGYAEFLYEVFSEGAQHPLWVSTHARGWDIYPVVNGELSDPPILVVGYDQSNWLSCSADRDRGRQINTLWYAGCPVIFWPRTADSILRGSEDADRGGLLFDKFDNYGEIGLGVTQKIIGRLWQSPQLVWENLEYWAEPVVNA